MQPTEEKYIIREHFSGSAVVVNTTSVTQNKTVPTAINMLYGQKLNQLQRTVNFHKSLSHFVNTTA